MSKRLTKRIVEQLLPGVRDQFVWDLDLKGFGVRIWPSGRKTFVAKYRVGGGRTGTTRRLTIGTYGAITVDEARLLAKKALGAVVAGDDPAGKRQARRREMTVTSLIDLYSAEGTRHLKERNRRYLIARLNHHVRPLLGAKRISEVKALDVEQFMRDVKVGKTAKDIVGDKPRARVIVRGGAGAAAKGLRDLSAMFAFAVRRELLSSNPCSLVKNPSDGKRTRFLSLDEVNRFGSALEELKVEGASPKAINIMRLWALTGCRRNEIAALKWSEVDFDRACLSLEDSKTGRSVRPLAGAAILLLRSVEQTRGSLYVFPSETGNTYYQGTKRFWAKVVRRAGLEGVTPHTLRHTIGSAAVSSGETLAMTGALLGHADNRSTSIYAHMQQDPARRAADRVVGPIATALGVQSAAEVVPLAAPKKL